MDELSFRDRFLRVYRADEVIFEEGSCGDSMYVIHSGGVEISRNVRGKKVQVAMLAKGDIFGEMALVEGLPRSATATAFSDNTEILEVDHGHFVYLLGQQPAFALMVIKVLCNRIRLLMNTKDSQGLA